MTKPIIVALASLLLGLWFVPGPLDAGFRLDLGFRTEPLVSPGFRPDLGIRLAPVHPGFFPHKPLHPGFRFIVVTPFFVCPCSFSSWESPPDPVWFAEKGEVNDPAPFASLKPGPPPTPSRINLNYSELMIEARPEETEIWLDGRFNGLARDYSGSALLSAAPGIHEVKFKLGNTVVSNQVDIAPGSRQVVSQAFPPGPGIPEPPKAAPPGPGVPESPKATPPGPGFSEPSKAAPPGRTSMLKLTISEPDAVIYIDGRYIMTGKESATTKIPLTPGGHKLEVILSGYNPHAEYLVVFGGEEVNLNVSLKKR